MGLRGKLLHRLTLARPAAQPQIPSQAIALYCALKFPALPTHELL
jgi:hypothetical protein